MVPSILSRPEGKRRPRQSVSFTDNEAEVVVEVESCFDHPEDIREALFHSRSEYHFSKSSARVVAKEAERYGYSRHLDGAYLSSYDQQVQDSLNLWCLHGHSRRGLERWCNGPHGQARKEDSYMYIHGVLRAQAEMKLKDEFRHERLREVGHVLSRKSRLFAQMLGEADSESAKWEFGMVDARPLSPVQPKRKNLGLSSGGAAAPAARSSISRSAAPARRSSAARAVAPKITIRTRPGRVPRMA
jgi:hypothetical protein